MIDLMLRCVPPSTTAQQAKRVQVVRNRQGRHVPRFFRSAAIEREAHTWAVLLRPHVPPRPVTGAVTLAITLVYPHRRRTAKRDRASLIAKVSKPDAGNAAKHIEDTLVRMRFLEDDQQVARLLIEKWHGPADQVGIRIQIRPLASAEEGLA